jgi:hypothetical protein
MSRIYPVGGREFELRIRELRKRAKKSEADLCAAIYPEPKFWWEARKMLRGEWFGLSLNQAIKIADALGCTLDELAGRHDAAGE